MQIGSNFALITIVQFPTSIKVDGTYAYIAGYGTSTPNQFAIINISNAFAPVIVGTNTTFLPVGTNSVLDIQGNYALVCTGNTMSIINIYNVSTITTVTGSLILTGVPPITIINWIKCKNNLAYICGNTTNNPTTSVGYVFIVDFTNVAIPILVSTIQVMSPNNIITSNYITEKYLFFTATSATSSAATLNIFDISNPSTPTVINTLAINSLDSIIVQNQIAYVLNTINNTVQLINLNNISSPVVLGSIPVNANGVQLLVKGTILYVIGNGFLQIFDLAGAYIQQLVAGGIDVNTLNVRDRLDLNGDADIRGGINISRSAFINGDLGVGGTVYSVSDRRKKTGISEIKDALGILKKLNPVRYKWCSEVLIKNKDLTDREYLGFIAQEIQEIIPESVKIDMDGYYTVNYMSFIPILTSAIKEQDKEIIKLRRMIYSLDPSLEFRE